ncbi:MAG: L,D-transpeptidase family protein [Firmicutes bacterium]|nr:L,D-transpeptidase family protein [Bacillota bacterium]
MVYASRYLRLMSPPMTGPDVATVQGRLRTLGIYRGAVNGTFDQATDTAVREFQRRNGLDADGVVGPETYSLLLPGTTGGRSDHSIAIDVDRKILTLRGPGGRFIKNYPVAVGTPATPTPVGNWNIVQKSENWGGGFGARWMGLNVPWGSYGIHGTNNPASIGTAASHGCIRMHNEDVIEVYNQVPLGTPVRITGTVFTGRILTDGLVGTDVREVQNRLNVLGYYQGDIDGVFGPQTIEAVRAFQRDQGLSPDGQVGPRTYNALQQAYDIALGNRQP